jgi:small subunit ribosomal protein S1
MIEQEITIRVSDDPFDTKTFKVRVPKGTKILCTEPYAIEALAQYGLMESVEDQIKLCETRQSYSTEGSIISITKDKDGNKISALIDIGTKYTASCSLIKEPKSILDQLEVGMIVNVKIKSGAHGIITASISDAIDEVKTNEIMKSIGDKTVGFTGKITELIHGGYWVEVGGIKCFMPGSLAGLNKLHNFESLVGQELIVMPISFSDEKNTIIVSHRAYLKTLIPSALDDLRENVKQPITGFVTGTTKFGVFAEFNKCLTGLIPDTVLDDTTRQLFERDGIKPGDSISFWVQEIVSDKKIILTQQGPREDIWDDAAEKYKPMMVTSGTVTKVTKYGAFVELEKGISGLIHKTKLKDTPINRGDKVNIKILSISPSDRKIAMSLID